jgi:hypothetical protein
VSYPSLICFYRFGLVFPPFLLFVGYRFIMLRLDRSVWALGQTVDASQRARRVVCETIASGMWV